MLLKLSARPESWAPYRATLSRERHSKCLIKCCFGMIPGLSHLRHVSNVYALRWEYACGNADCLRSNTARMFTVRLSYRYGTNLDNTERYLAAHMTFWRSKFSYGHSSQLRQGLDWLSAADLVEYHALSCLHKTWQIFHSQDFANTRSPTVQLEWE